MFAALGRFVTRFPWLVVAAWVILAVLVISFAPKLTSTSDESEFLPAHYESIKAATIQQKEFPASSQPGAILVFDHADGSPLSTDDQRQAADVVTALNDRVAGTHTFSTGAVAGVSKDQKVATRDRRPDEGRDRLRHAVDGRRVKKLRKDLKPLVADTELRVRTTGPAPQSLDSQESSAKTLQIVGIATILLIVVLLALIFRSVIICLLPIVVVGSSRRSPPD